MQDGNGVAAGGKKASGTAKDHMEKDSEKKCRQEKWASWAEAKAEAKDWQYTLSSPSRHAIT